VKIQGTSSCHDSPSIEPVFKTEKKRYRIVTNEKRQYFLQLMKDKKMKIRQAAKMADIGYENAKVIKRIFK